MSKIVRLLEKIFKEFGTFDNSIFKRIHLYLVDNYILYYDSYHNYQDRVEPPFKRKIMYHGISLLLISVLIKFFLLTLFDDDSLKINMGDILPVYTAYYRKGYIFFINFLLLFIMFRRVILYYEKKLTININEIKTINNGSNIFKYNNNESSLIIIANFAYWIKYFYLIGFYLISTLHIIFSLATYIFTHNNYNIIILMVSTIHNIICFKILNTNYPGYAMITLTTFIFLKLKQNDIIKSIRFNVLWRNKFRLYDNLKQYHQFTRLVDKLGKLINVLSGIIYLITPFFISQILWILTEEEPKNLLDKVAQVLFIFMVIVMIIVIYIFDDILSRIAKVSHHLPKYLYPIFHDKQFTRFQHTIGLNLNYRSGILSDIMVRIKIDSFIARLNEEFVGFYCFNLFEVTKLAFFEYIYMLMSVFVLIQDFQL